MTDTQKKLSDTVSWLREAPIEACDEADSECLGRLATLLEALGPVAEIDLGPTDSMEYAINKLYHIRNAVEGVQKALEQLK